MTRMPRSHYSRAMTLTELLITIVVLGILVSMAIPSYLRAIERSYWRGARDTLLTIYAGEQTHYSLNSVFLPVGPGSSQAEWRQIYMDDPNPTDGSVTYTVTASGTGPSATFQATARRGQGRCQGSTLQIDQNRAITPSDVEDSWGWSGCS